MHPPASSLVVALDARRDLHRTQQLSNVPFVVNGQAHFQWMRHRSNKNHFCPQKTAEIHFAAARERIRNIIVFVGKVLSVPKF